MSGIGDNLSQMTFACFGTVPFNPKEQVRRTKKLSFRARHSFRMQILIGKPTSTEWTVLERPASYSGLESQLPIACTGTRFLPRPSTIFGSTLNRADSTKRKSTSFKQPQR